MKFKFNPLTGEFNLVPDSGTLKQKLNWLTGEFNLTKDAGKYKQIYNAIEGEFNLRPAVTQVVVHGVGSIQLTNAVENGLLSLKAFGGTEQRSLPSEYTQLEYITLNKSYFDTGITPTTDTDYELKFTIAQNNTTQGAMGMLNNSTPTNNFYFMVSSGNKFLSALGTAAITLNDLPTVTVDTDYLVKVNGETLTVNDVEASNFSRGTLEATQTIDLGCRKNSENNGLTGKLYYFKIWKGGVLVAHYVPCKRKSDDVLGYYDIVNDTFGVLLTTYGTPVAGPNIVPTPTAPIDIVSNNGVLKARHQSGLPLGYKKLLSIYNSTSATLDTGIKLANTDRVETRFFNASTSQYGAWYGIYATGESSAFYANGTYYGYDAVNNKINTGVSIDTNGHDLVHDFVNGKITLDGVDTLFTPFEFTNSVNNKLFCRYYNNSYGYNVKGWITYYKVYRNNVLILDLVPCTRESDNTVGMYDMVSGTFIGPDEGYTFEEGTAATDPIEIYTDGITETINIHTKNLFNKNSSLTNGYINSSGAIVSTNSLKLSPFIEIKPNTTYTISGTGNVQALSFDRYAYTYTAEQTPIAQVPSQSGGASATFTTASNAKYIRIQMTPDAVSTCQLELGSTATTYVPYFDGGTATAEMLLKVGDYVDEQEILSGNITRKVGAKVLDGTENWGYGGNTSGQGFYLLIPEVKLGEKPICTHFKQGSIYGYGIADKSISRFSDTSQSIIIKYNACLSGDSTNVFKAFLADQYAAGTPVIIIYPLATPTTETVTGQPLTIPAGDSTIEIVQASLDNLELEATYEQEA